MNGASIAEGLEKHGLLDLANEVATCYHLTLDELLGPGRRRYDANARRVLWTRAYALIPCFFRLARLFGRDHTTIRYAVLGRKRRRRCAERICVDLAGCDMTDRPNVLAQHADAIATCDTVLSSVEDEPC